MTNDKSDTILAVSGISPVFSVMFETLDIVEGQNAEIIK